MRAAIAIPLGALLACVAHRHRLPELRHGLQPALGRRPAAGRRPDLDVPLAPTPHPLATLVGVVLTPLGDAGQPAWVVLAFLALGALALGDLRARRALVRARRRASSPRVADPDPRPGPELRRARLPGHPVRRARAGRDPRRGAPRARARAAAARASPACCGPEAWLFAFAYVAWKRDAAAAPAGRSPRPCCGCSTTWCSPGTRCTRSPTRRTTPRPAAHHRPRRRAADRPAPARRDPARAGPARRGGGRGARPRVHAPTGRAADRGRVRLARRVLRARGRRAADPRPLPAAARPRCSPSSPARACSAGCALPPRPPWRRRWAAIGGAVLAAFVVFAPTRRTASPTCAPRCTRRRRSSPTCTRSATRSPAGRSPCPTTGRSRTSRCGPASRRATSSPPNSSSRRRGSYIDPANERVAAQLHARPARPEAPDGDRAAGFERVGAQPALGALRRC